MPSEPLKFRCDRCGQLLGVAPSRVGRAVNCPKCGTSLIVPDPIAGAASLGAKGTTPTRSEEPSTHVSSSDESRPTSSGFFDAVELSSDELRTLFPEETAEGETATDRDAESGTLSSSEPDLMPERLADEVERSGANDAPVPEAIGLLLREHPNRSASLTNRSELGDSDEVMARPRPSRDVVIPRLAVLSWSLFVVIALFLAFVAGLLVGHFVWVRSG